LRRSWTGQPTPGGNGGQPARYLPIPGKPGWGYEVNEEAFKHYPPKPWRRGFAYRPDGSPDFI